MQPSRTSAEALLRRLWRQKGAATLLLPASVLFYYVYRLRRALYRTHLLESHRLPVPVVVVGNLTVGGAGKTPLVLHLAQRLAALGLQPGIVSRGYGSLLSSPREVQVESRPEDVGDEALLLKQRSGVPVFVARERAQAAKALLAGHPQCNVILCDDGLQHYALQRDVEIAVIDRRGFMNGWMLPAGPLREPVERLADVDAVVLNDASVALRANVPQFRMRLSGTRFQLLGDPGQQCGAADLRGKKLVAVAGIGEPQRFFDHLQQMGLRFKPLAFADHYRYTAADFQIAADAILTTEKDAVKCAGLTQIPIWVLPVDAELKPDLARFITDVLSRKKLNPLEMTDGPAPA